MCMRESRYLLVTLDTPDLDVSQSPVTCAKLTLETLERWCRSGVFIVNFEHISHLGLVFLLLTLSR